MARTPLLRSLQSLYRDYKVAKANNLSLDALRDVRARPRDGRAEQPSRRQFLAGASAAGVATLTVSPRQARASGASVVIVGGGIAGLNCALTLADRGINAQVYEAAGRIGGRMFSNRNYFASGQVTEWGGELIDTGHKTVRKLAKRFGLKLDDLLAAQPAGSQDVNFFDGVYYPKTQADADFAVVFDAVVADEASAPFPTLFDSFTPQAEVLDQLSIYDWIETRVPGGHRSPLGQLLDTAYAIEYAADTRHQSSLNLIYLLAFQPNAGTLSIFGESDERFHIRGGNQQLPERIAAYLGNQVVMGHRLAKIARTSSGRNKLTFERGGSPLEVLADYVVLALPFAVLREIDFDKAGFDALKIEAIETQGAGRSGKLNVQFQNRIWNGTGPWPGVGNGATYSDTGYQASWDATRAQAGTPGVLVFFSGGSVADAAISKTAFATASSGDVLADATLAMQRAQLVIPGLQAQFNGRATQSLPHLSPFFRSSYSFYQPGQYTTFAGHEAARQGRVLFCGEHTSIDFQGFMEGGATEGERAGKELIALLGLARGVTARRPAPSGVGATRRAKLGPCSNAPARPAVGTSKTARSPTSRASRSVPSACVRKRRLRADSSGPVVLLTAPFQRGWGLRRRLSRSRERLRPRSGLGVADVNSTHQGDFSFLRLGRLARLDLRGHFEPRRCRRCRHCHRAHGDRRGRAHGHAKGAIRNRRGRCHRARAGDKGQAPPPFTADTLGAIAGQHAAIGAAEHTHTDPSFGPLHQRLGLVALHTREVVDILLALAAVAHSIVACHRAPVGLAGRSNAQALERERLTERRKPLGDLGTLGLEARTGLVERPLLLGQRLHVAQLSVEGRESLTQCAFVVAVGCRHRPRLYAGGRRKFWTPPRFVRPPGRRPRCDGGAYFQTTRAGLGSAPPLVPRPS